MSSTVNGQVRQDLAHARRAACHNPSCADAQAPQHLAPTSCHASTRNTFSAGSLFSRFSSRKRPFRVVVVARLQQSIDLGGSHLNCARWLWVEGRGEYSHDGGCGWLAPGDVRMYWLPQLQGFSPAVPQAICTSRQAQSGVCYHAQSGHWQSITGQQRRWWLGQSGAGPGRCGPGCWGGSNRTPGAPGAPPTTQTTAPQESARKMLLISCML